MCFNENPSGHCPDCLIFRVKRKIFSGKKYIYIKMRYLECRKLHVRFLLFAVAVCIGLAFTACSSASKENHLVRGEEYLQKRKYEEAVMEFRAASDIDKDSAEAHWGLARAYEQLGKFYETIEELRQVTTLNPENLEAKAKLGNYYLLFNPPQTDETEKLLKDIFARNPNFIEAHILKASLWAIQGKSENEIVGVLNKAISLEPKRTESYMSLARYFMKTGKAEKAENAIQKGIAANPNAALGYTEYGRFLVFADRSDEAERQFTKAIEVEPRNVEARLAQAEYYVGEKAYPKAEHTYKELIKSEQNSSESRMELANFYDRIGEDERAVNVFNQILKDAPEYVRARYRLGEIYLNRKESAKVNEQVEYLLNLNDTDVEALTLLARVRLQEGNAEEAIKSLEEILKKQPSRRDALYYMTQARIQAGQIDQARAFVGDLEKYHSGYLKTKLLKIQLSFASGETEIALQQANELLRDLKNAQPNQENDGKTLSEMRFRALTARGLANLQFGKISEAKADLQKVYELAPNSAAALINLAKVNIAQGNSAEALNFYEKALAWDDKNFDALSGVIGVLTGKKDFGRAHRKIDEALGKNAARNTNAAALHYLKSDVFKAEGNLEAAENELKKIFSIDENYLPAYSAYAAILMKRNQLNQAVEQYKRSIEKKPSASVYALLGILEDTRGNAAAAEQNYRKSLEIDPKMPIAANNLAWLIAEKQGNLDEALKLAQTAVDRNQNVAGYYDTLGWVYHKKGLHLPAVEQLRKAVALDDAEAGNSEPAYRLRLGIALASSGDKDSARREVAVSLQNGSRLTRREVQEAKNLLAGL